MKISVNGESVELEQQLTIPQLLEKLNITSLGTAVAVNNVIIRRDNWDSYLIVEDSKVAIIRATQGG